MDEDDPVEAWRRRSAELQSVAERLTEMRLDALRFRGPGTDLTVGLLPTSRWVGGGEKTVDGIAHMANLPTEEVFTDARPDAHVRRRPRDEAARDGRLDGAGLEVRFEDGRAVEFRADSGPGARGAQRSATRAGRGSARSPWSIATAGSRRSTRCSSTRSSTRTRRATSPSEAPTRSVGEEDLDRVNRSEIHVDFMIGGDDVAVTGITTSGSEVEILTGGAWAFG